MPDILEQIVDKTRERLKAQKLRLPLADLLRQTPRSKRRSFARALRRPDGISIIAELKQASPSAGIIRQESDLAGRIRGYALGGAAALSILTEEDYFRGSPYVLEIARKETDLPLLRKDFIIDPYQIEESCHMGADAILLITTLLAPSLLKEMIDHARSAGLDSLVETHNEDDLRKALDAGADVIGINHRNLRTLKMDLTIAERLLPQIPKQGKTLVVESGIRKPEEAARFHALGAQAVLIGETLMRSADAESIVRSFVQGGRAPDRKSA
jgi:indole-3-glycerol phosphate synthase